jgi:hypothetical protein
MHSAWTRCAKRDIAVQVKFGRETYQPRGWIVLTLDALLQDNEMI